MVDEGEGLRRGGKRGEIREGVPWGKGTGAGRGGTG